MGWERTEQQQKPKEAVEMEMRAVLPEVDPNPSVPSLSQLASQMVRGELQPLMLEVCQDRLARK